MTRPASITIPTEPTGSIPGPVDLVERIAKGDREDPDPLLSMEVRSETTVYRPLWVHDSHFVHSLYQRDNPGAGSSKPCLLACLVRSRFADRLQRNNGWDLSRGCAACCPGSRWHK